MKAPITPDRASQRPLSAHLAEAIAILATLALCAAAGALWAIIEGAMS